MAASTTGSLNPVPSAREAEIAKFCQLADIMPAFVAIYQGTTYRFVSAGARAIVGYSPGELMGTSFLHVVHPEHRELVRERGEARLRGEDVPDRYEVKLLHKDGSERWVDLSVAKFEYEYEPAVLGIALDITARKAEEARFHMLFHRAPVGMFLLDSLATNRILEANRAAAETLGCERPALVDQTLDSFILDASERTQMREQFGLVGSRARKSCRFSTRLRHASGREVWARVSAWLLADGTEVQRRCVATIEDATEQEEVRRQLVAEQALLRQLLRLQDREKSLVAYEIHDGLIQDMVGSLMMLDSLAGQYEDKGDPVPDQVRRARVALGRALSEGRQLITELRPAILDQLGVVDAIRSLIDSEQAVAGLRIQFDYRVEFQRLPVLLEGTIYRIVQEAINNIKKHAKSDEVEIRLTEVGRSTLILEIQDHGVGFDPAVIPAKCYGVEGIRERARLFGGGATIESGPGRGTRITVKLPFELPKQPVPPPNSPVEWIV